MTVSVDGKVQGWYVPRDVAWYFEHNPHRAELLYRGLRVMSDPLKRMFTVNNPGFGLWNLQRDARALVLNLPGNAATQPFQVARSYLRTARDAWLDAFADHSTLYAEDLYRANVLIAGRGYRVEEFGGVDTELERLMLRWERDPRNERRFWRKVGKWVFNDFNQFMERWSKFAGADHLQREGYDLADPATREMIRSRAGSPDFLERGSWTPITNTVFLFSNAQIQGLRASGQALRMSPANYALKLGVYNILPKLLMSAATAGMLDYLLSGDDDDKPIQRAMQNIPERDRENYLTIPLGVNTDGKTRYLVLPQDHVGQFAGKLVSVALTEGARPVEFAQAMASQSPYGLAQANPVLELLYDVASYAVGVNPVDLWRGEHVLDETTFKAGGVEAWKDLGLHAWNNLFSTTVAPMGRNTVTGDDPVERATQVPGVGPVLRRFLRVSDRGQDDRLRRTLEEAEREEARISLRIGKWISSEIERYGGEGLPRESALKAHAGRAFYRAKRENVFDRGYTKAAFVQRYVSAAIYRYGSAAQQAERGAGRLGRAALEDLQR